ncbi:putative adhesin [Yersinia mollaretii]|uniref:Intimin n=1 Tax=Yersinia mollaretii TaxID=33060 RepID=A0AA36LMB5_YERMO|nr:inverse autotransporter beta-barrel domain-containing protein [Yersinia mollaretii]CNH77589.1 putative adhesin [Yersinia mollaretii]
MGSILKGIKHYLCFGFLKKVIVYLQIVLQTLLGTLPLYSMSFSTHADSDIAKKTSLFKRLHTLTATDTLESVASNYGLSVDELWALNINLYNNRSIFDAIKYGAVVYVPNREEEQKTTQQASLVASHLSQIGSTLSSESRVEAFSRLAKGVLLSSTAKSVEEWLGHIGKAQIKLQADDKNDFSGSELDLFIPLYDQPERLAFSQFGFRRIDQRNIMNIGLGQRHYLSDWMLGYNVFFDQQISGNAHRRLGLGGELARDYVKLSANSYYRLGGWKNSTRLEDYDERAANGYDIRTEAYLPYYPQLGGKLMYEQYFGNEVALFGLNERQKNPSALTASVSYTPFPLVNLALEHTIGNSGKNKTGVNLAVNYEINTPWQKQIDPAAVQTTRTLAGSRMDLVDRNNNIVLEYRKQQVVTLNLPAKVSGKEKQVLPINYTFNARHGLDRIEWDAADVINAGGNVSDQGNLVYHITFPPYIDGGDNAYVLAGRAVDKKGNYSVSNSTNLYVTGVNINPIKSTITLTPATLPANTTSRSILQLKLSTDAGHAVSGATGNITFAVRDVSGNVPRARTLAQPVVIGDVQEIQTGVYEASVTSGNLVGRFEITPTVRGVQLNPIILTQSADATTATINGSANITISTPTITANATDKTHLEVLVTDALGHPVPGVEVTWVSDLNSPGLEQVTSITNEHGIAENDFSSTITGTANITVQTGTSPPVQAGTIEIKPDNSTMTVNASNFTVTKTLVVANGTNEAGYNLKVTDKQGNAVPATAVEWSSNIGSFTQGNTTTTDANGETSVALVSTKAELAKVTVRVGGKLYAATAVTFIADRQTAGIKLLPPSKNSAAANDKDNITLNAKIADADGNPLINEKVNWEVLGHQVTFDPATGNTQTNDLGETQITLTSSNVGDVTLNARVEKGDLAVNLATEKLSFTADAVTAKVSGWLAPTDTTLTADGQAKVTYQVVVKDNKGHVVPNSPVHWKTSLGEFVVAQATTAISSTDSLGVAEVALSSTQAGSASVSASVNGNNSKSSAKVEFTANSSSARIAIAPVTQYDFVANGNEQATYTVTVVDANNNPVKAEAISWKSENNHRVDINPTSSQTDDNGKATVNVSSLKAGKTQIRATLGNSATAIADEITFNANRQTAKVAQVSVEGSSKATADGNGVIHYKAEVTDANGNPVPGMTLSWGSNINKFVQSWSTTDSAGHSMAQLSGTQAGSVTAFAQLTSGNHASEQKENNQAEFIAAMPVSANSSLLLVPKLIIADGKQKSTLKFTLRDANHNPVSGLAKDITVTQASANHVTVGAITESAVKGVYQATVSGMKEGSVDLTATVKAGSVSKAQTLTLQADNKTASLKSVTSNQPTAKADGTESITYRAKVIDAQGNASLENVSVGWRTDLGELAAITKTDKSGIATVTLTSKQAGSATVTAIVSSNSEMTAAPVTFTAGAISIAHSSSHLSSVDLVADGVTSTQVTVKVNDLHGNPLVGQSGNIKLTAANFPGLVLGQFTEMPNGVYTATLTGTKAGEGEIVTELDGSELTKQKLKLIADVRTAKIGELTPSKSGSLTVGDKVTYRATIKDANDNQLGADIPVYWSVNRDTLISGSKLMSLTNRAGVADVEISRNMQGDALVTATVGRNSKQATAVNFMSGGIDMSQSTANLLTKEITANNLDVATIQVDLRDSKGNPLANLQSQITTSPTSGEHGLDITTQANPSGGYLVNIKGYKAGEHTVKVSVAGKPFVKKAYITLIGDVASAELDTVEVNRMTFKADNNDLVIYTATVVDANNNPVGNFPVSWRLAQGEGQYQSLSYTGTTGKAETKLSASRLGQYKMEAQVRGVAKVAPDVSTTAGDMVPSQSNFVVDVNSIDASGKTKAKLTATLKDKFGNLLKGQTVNVKETQNLTGIKFSVNPMKDNGDGTYSTEVTSTTKGNTQFIASINAVDLIQQPQLLVGNIIPQLSFDNKNMKEIYTKARKQKQVLKGLPQGVTPHWSSDNSEVAKVDQTTGEIELLKAGVVNISAFTLPDNTYGMGKASYQLTVDKADPQLNFPIAKQDIKWMDSVSPQSLVLSNSDVTQGELNTIWQSGDNKIATVDSTGNVALVKPGATKIKVVSMENERFKYSEASYELNVAKYKQPISFANRLQQNKDSDSIAVQKTQETLPRDVNLQTEWSSSASGVVTVAADGTLAAIKGPGQANITLKVVGNDWYEAQSGSYQQEVFAKPNISIRSTTAISNKVRKDNAREWSPVFTDDGLEVVVNTANSKYEKADSVTAVLLGDGQELERKSDGISTAATIKFMPKAGWVGKSLKVRVIAEGSFGQQNTIDLPNEIKVATLEPIDIWKKATLTRRYTLHNNNGSQRDSCPTANNLFEPNFAQLTWRIQLDLNDDMLHPMKIKLLESRSSNNGINMAQIPSPTREIYDSYSNNGDNRVMDKCIKKEYGNYSTYMNIEYVGREYKYVTEGELYWEGGGSGRDIDRHHDFKRTP